MINKIIFLGIASMLPSILWAQDQQRPTTEDVDTTQLSYGEQHLHEVSVMARKPGLTRSTGILNGLMTHQDELFKAACCNLGESFTTNPSVDVNYSDAATGARQIKLLGLSGTYVQMLTENLPAFRGGSLALLLGLHPRTLDEKHSGKQRLCLGEEWLRVDHWSD